MDKKNSGVGVLDKAVGILATLESGPHSLAELVAATGIARPTAHRLAVALEFHRLVARDLNGRFILGPRSAELAAAAGEDGAANASGLVGEGGRAQEPAHGLESDPQVSLRRVAGSTLPCQLPRAAEPQLTAEGAGG